MVQMSDVLSITIFKKVVWAFWKNRGRGEVEKSQRKKIPEGK